MKSLSALAALSLGVFAMNASAAVIVPDNGGGTIDFPPPGATYVVCPGFSQMHIIDGLVPASQINIDPALHSWYNVVESPGGVFGADTQNFNFVLDFSMNGTGVYSAYSRNISFGAAQGITDIAARTPFAPVQNFLTDLRGIQAQVTGDPDFDLLRITAGTSFGMPSPGQTTLTAAGPAWSVDSFFDIIYRIDFVGNPAGPFAGRSGSTTGETRIWIVPAPAAAGVFMLAGLSAASRRRRHPA